MNSDYDNDYDSDYDGDFDNDYDIDYMDMLGDPDTYADELAEYQYNFSQKNRDDKFYNNIDDDVEISDSENEEDSFHRKLNETTYCQNCGKEITLQAPNQKYCKHCAKLRKKHRYKLERTDFGCPEDIGKENHKGYCVICSHHFKIPNTERALNSAIYNFCPTCRKKYLNMRKRYAKYKTQRYENRIVLYQKNNQDYYLIAEPKAKQLFDDGFIYWKAKRASNKQGNIHYDWVITMANGYKREKVFAKQENVVDFDIRRYTTRNNEKKPYYAFVPELNKKVRSGWKWVNTKNYDIIKPTADILPEWLSDWDREECNFSEKNHTWHMYALKYDGEMKKTSFKRLPIVVNMDIEE